jgi:CheY-like chemotaxis protein
VRRALVVDDDAQLRSDIRSGLESMGWECEGMSVEGASQGLPDDRIARYALVLMALGSPGFGDLASAAREAPGGRLVVAIADLDRRAELESAIRSGSADDFLPLPFSLHDLRGLCKLAEGGKT